MNRISLHKVIQFHDLLIEQTGGLLGIRDEGALESAVCLPFQTFHGVELYPSIEAKAARMGCSIIQNHPFIDGNKRTGLYSMLIFMEVNNKPVIAKTDELVSLAIQIAGNKIAFERVVDFLKHHQTGFAES